MKKGLPLVSPWSLSIRAVGCERPVTNVTNCATSAVRIADEIGQNHRHRMLVSAINRTARRNDQHRDVANIVCEIAQQLKRGRVGPVQIIEDDDQRALARSKSDERPGCS
jgi:hypothetical protein